MDDINTKAVGAGGELWVAGILQLQGADEGYRVALASIDDLGTDLFLLKYENNLFKELFEIQVKTARKVQKHNNVYFDIRRTVKHGLKSLKRTYIFLYAPNRVKYCWVISEKEIEEKFPNKKKNINFSSIENASDKGSYYRCRPEELFEKVIEKIKIAKEE